MLSPKGGVVTSFEASLKKRGGGSLLLGAEATGVKNTSPQLTKRTWFNSGMI